MKKETFEIVGQAKIFALANSSRDKSIIGKVDNVSNLQVTVSFPLDTLNGVRGVTATFMRSQFTADPRVGQEIKVKNGLVTLM